MMSSKNQKRVAFSSRTKKHDGKSLPPEGRPKPRQRTATGNDTAHQRQTISKQDHFQKCLYKKCVDEGVHKVEHVGILRKKSNKDNINSSHFFLGHSDSAVTFPEQKITFQLIHQKLYVKTETGCGSKGTYQITRKSGEEALMVENEKYELFRGDRVDLGKIDSTYKFVTRVHFITHQAPLKEEPVPQAQTAAGKRAGSKRASAGAYPKSRGVQDIRKARRVRRRVETASAVAQRSGNKHGKKERKKAAKYIKSVGMKRCPYECQYGKCYVPNCPYLHRNKPPEAKEDYKTGDRVSNAVVYKWNTEKGFGFARAPNGVEFFFHKNQLKFGNSTILCGATIDLTVKKNLGNGRKDEATEVTVK